MFQAITITEISSVKVIRSSHEQIDMFSIVEIVEDLENVIAPNVYLLFDLSSVQFIDSSGLGGLIKIQKKLVALAGKLAICNATKNVQNLLKLTQSSKFLPCFEDIETGVKRLPSCKLDF